MTHMLYQAPAPGKQTGGTAYYYMMERETDEKGVMRFKKQLG